MMIVNQRLQRIVLPSIFVLLLVVGWIAFQGLGGPHGAPARSAVDGAEPEMSLVQLSLQVQDFGAIDQVTLIQDGLITNAESIDAPNSGVVVELELGGPPENVAAAALKGCQLFYAAFNEAIVLNVHRVDCILVFKGDKRRLPDYEFNQNPRTDLLRKSKPLNQRISEWANRAAEKTRDN
ncbi:hypothetical protein V5R04_11425 [Jonesiaceae bacterium BS-20]|uniref:GerMN domain-containing protein n=1 Tax=Jonesiaceae bacterium BS-20 TaxID=3120821 RepID=A0AAU7DTQ8_9MICO